MKNAIADAINVGQPAITVTKQHVQDASRTIARGPVCVAARTSPRGTGPYCPE
jgi:hypothetical protein